MPECGFFLTRIWLYETFYIKTYAEKCGHRKFEYWLILRSAFCTESFKLGMYSEFGNIPVETNGYSLFRFLAHPV